MRGGLTEGVGGVKRYLVVLVCAKIWEELVVCKPNFILLLILFSFTLHDFLGRNRERVVLMKSWIR